MTGRPRSECGGPLDGVAMSWIVGIDVGGTFTDFYAFDGASGRVVTYKHPSTSDNPARAIITGLRRMAVEHGVSIANIDRLGHGTTVATNALLEGRGGRTALITTAGFRDLIEIARQQRPHMYDMQTDFRPPVVPRERRFEVRERILADGSVRVPLSEEDVDAAVEAVAASGAESCAVCFLFGFKNPAHEQAVREKLRAALPGLHISLASEIQPEFREYERTSTTVLNAFLQPVVADYLADLGNQLEELIPSAHVGINQSSGGLTSIRRAQQAPIRTALSGPAAGAVGAAFIAKLSERPDVITLDVGGTSADVCLIRKGAFSYTFDREIGGFPVRQPMVDINTVGAGGGSIAWFDHDDLLKVGPVSAGASPGPACYGSGGEHATVTDANLVLGRLSTRGLLDGRLQLDVGLARRAFEPIARKLGYTLERAALGVLAIAISNMVRAIRAISVERGHDARSFALMPFGGAGPLHAVDVARSLGIREIIVPDAPGILCAQGLVVSDLTENFVRSARTRVERGTAGVIAEMARMLRTDAARWFAEEGIDAAHQHERFVLDMRYIGQNFELPVEVDPTNVPEVETLRRAFFAVHEDAYGHFSAEDPVEIVNYRLSARGVLRKPDPPRRQRTTSTPKPRERRLVHFSEVGAVETAVFERATLYPGQTIVGPAVIEQFDSTTIVYPGDRLTVDDYSNLRIEVQP